MKLLPTLLILLLFTFYFTGCGLAYGDPEAQFNEASLLATGKPFIGKMISVKGVVTKQDVSDPDNCMIYLSHSIRCNLGDMKSMAESYKVGKTVIITGYLERCEEADILLEPALGTDPNVEWNPVE
jgi:hypothetical protein